jgi:GH24 family phage-related lysozyme (muramidase)
MAVQNATDIARVDGAMNFIAQFENLGKTGSTGDAKLEPYADSAGFVTIGYGRNTGLQIGVDKTTFDNLSDAKQKTLLQEKLNEWANKSTTNKSFADQHLNTDSAGNYTSLKSEETAWRVFRKDTLKTMGIIRSDFGAALAALSPEQHVALTSLYFNVGSSTKFPKLFKILTTGRIQDASGAWRDATGEDIVREWGSKLEGVVKSGNVYEGGIQDRRLVELELFKKGSALRGGGPGGLVQRLPWTDASDQALATEWTNRLVSGPKTQWPTPGSSGWAGRGAFFRAGRMAPAGGPFSTDRFQPSREQDSAGDRPASLVPDTGGPSGDLRGLRHPVKLQPPVRKGASLLRDPDQRTAKLGRMARLV